MLFVSLYTPRVKSSGPPSPEHMAKMGALVEKSMKDGTLLYTGPLAKHVPGGAKIRLSKGTATVTHGPFSDSVLMAASGFALFRANSREDAERYVKDFMEVAGDGECQILQVLEFAPPAPTNNQLLAT
jgi:hypothetical protein